MTAARLFPHAPWRLLLAVLAAFACLVADISVAFAQSQNCAQIAAILRGIERDEMFVSFNGVVRELQNRQNEVTQAESLWSRAGCQQSINSRQALSRQCQSLAQTITLGRTQVEQLAAMASEGQALARNHQQLMTDFQRNGCDADRSGVTFGNQGTRGGLLGDMFGGGYDYNDTPFDAWSTQQTRRTVCVRTCDGFYWPISFSTTDNYISQDAIQCHEMCPATEVALFSYRNPGEEPEDMISLSGTPYRSMPYAFRFREEVDTSCSCQTREPMGTVAITTGGEQSQAVVDFGDVSIPLPRRDPRARMDAVVAEAVYVPLPRPRPGADTATAVAGPVASEEPDMRIVEFGDREVRIVGPETPFVPGPAEES